MGSEDAAFGATPVSTSNGVPVDQWGYLLERYRKCGPNARAMLLDQAKQLALGAERYGDDFDDDRDWLRETEREFGDAIHYAQRQGLGRGDSPLLQSLYHLAQAGFWLCRGIRERN